MSPRRDDILPPGGSVTVQLDVTEAGRVGQLTVNGYAAFPNGPVTGSTQRWVAFVAGPPDGAALTLNASAFDVFGNHSSASLVVDNDGIEAAIDRNRTTAADESGSYSSDFNWGGTAGTISRFSGARVTAVRRTANTVNVGMVNGGFTRVSVCGGSDKFIQLFQAGQSADITCAPTGTVTVRAYAGIGGSIDLWKQAIGTTYFVSGWSCHWVSGGWFSRGYSVCNPVLTPVTYTYYYEIVIWNGQTVSTGSPITADPENTLPIPVTLMQVGDDGSQIPVATFDVGPGASVDVSVTPRAKRQDDLDISVLAGTVTVTIGGLTQTIGTGQHGVVPLDNTPPTINVPGNITGAATSANGAVVTFSGTATDNVDGALPVTCAPASGSTFPIGATTVTCTAMDRHGNPASGSFTVTVGDTTPPALTVPANITTPATTFAGAPVSFAVSAIDLVDGSTSVACSKTSGSIFSIGTTTVSCTSVDAHGNSSTRTFTVTVTFTFQQARTLLQALIASLRSGNTAAACSQLAGVITVIQSQVGIRLTQAEATLLIRLANDARTALGCR